MNNPKHPEYQERKEWLGGKFDPDDFNSKNVVFISRKSRLWWND